MDSKDGQTSEPEKRSRKWPTVPSEVVVLVGGMCASLWDKFKFLGVCKSWKLAMGDKMAWAKCWIDWGDCKAPTGSAARMVQRMIRLLETHGEAMEDLRIYDRVRKPGQMFDALGSNSFVTLDLVKSIRVQCWKIERLELGGDNPVLHHSTNTHDWGTTEPQHDPKLIAEGVLDIAERVKTIKILGCNFLRGDQLEEIVKRQDIELTSAQCVVCLTDWRKKEAEQAGSAIRENIITDLQGHSMFPMVEDALDQHKLVQCEKCTGWTCMPCAGAKREWGTWFRHCRKCGRTICLKCNQPGYDNDYDEGDEVEGMLYPDIWAGELGRAFKCANFFCDTRKKHTHMVCDRCKPLQTLICRLRLNHRCETAEKLVCVGICQDDVRALTFRPGVQSCDVCRSEGCLSCLMRKACSLCGKPGCSQCPTNARLMELWTNSLFCATHAEDIDWTIFKKGERVGEMAVVCCNCWPSLECIVPRCTADRHVE